MSIARKISRSSRRASRRAPPARREIPAGGHEHQSGIGRGLYSEADFATLTAWMKQRFLESGAPLAAFTTVRITPTERSASYRRECSCRKPAAGMVATAARSLASTCLVDHVRRQDSDLEAARVAGVPCACCSEQMRASCRQCLRRRGWRAPCTGACSTHGRCALIARRAVWRRPDETADARLRGQLVRCEDLRRTLRDSRDRSYLPMACLTYCIGPRDYLARARAWAPRSLWPQQRCPVRMLNKERIAR
jgi:hypothetical protein